MDKDDASSTHGFWNQFFHFLCTNNTILYNATFLRCGSQYWGCKVWRQGPSVAHDSADIDGQNALRNFMKRYKKYIPWNNYALACGDVRRCCELRLFDWNDENDEEENLENDNDDEKEAEE